MAVFLENEWKTSGLEKEGSKVLYFQPFSLLKETTFCNISML